MQYQFETLTVAIPTWNRRERIKPTLESICIQPEAGLINIIILDNGSDDKYESSLEVLKKSKIPYRYLRNQTNVGMCANILRCVEESVTDWVWILGDDDPVTPDALSRLIPAINKS